MILEVAVPEFSSGGARSPDVFTIGDRALRRSMPVDLACDLCGRIVYFEDQDKIPKYYLEAAKICAILENTGMFFWAYEMSFNKHKLTAKEFFPSIDMEFLTLIDIDAKQLLLELWDSPSSMFFKIVETSLDVAIETDGAPESMGLITKTRIKDPQTSRRLTRVLHGSKGHGRASRRAMG
ncbi:hypothetical protein COCNU_01G016770 [Cocos nucifera]|uniref:Uncharacterized protein n=1 Tax=Cocos nucifera TaxID=13894 RepID=A0A8K0HWV6_COCNU|nr:hypothetical protein COCNU_01G016770 [Cocos nucifera]